jgi:hypothetical protein
MRVKIQYPIVLLCSSLYLYDILVLLMERPDTFKLSNIQQLAEY